MPQPSTHDGGFRGIAPSGLRLVAATCGDRRRVLDDAASEIMAVALRTPTRHLDPLPRRLAELARRLAEWAAELESRAAAVERIQDAVNGVFESIVAALRDAVGELASGDGASVRPLAVDEAYGRLDRLLVSNDGSGSSERARIAATIDVMAPADVVLLIDALLAAGHGLPAVAEVAAAVGSSERAISIDLLEAFAEPVDRGELGAITFVGHLLGTNARSDRAVASWLTQTPGRVVAVLRGAAVHAKTSGRSIPTADGIGLLLTELDDVERIAAVIVELVAARHDRTLAPELPPIDATISALFDVDPRGVTKHLATNADRDATTMVTWMQGLIGTEHGPEYLGRLIDGVGGIPHLDVPWFTDPGPHATFDNAATAAYLAASLSIAVRREAGEAHRTIGTIGWAAGVGEMLIPVAGGITRVVDLLVPVSLASGVGIAADEANARIEASMNRLLAKIEERFEVPADAATADLAGALDAFDERRDALVQHWSGS